MIKRIFRWFGLGAIVLILTSGSTFAGERQLTVHLEEVFDGKVSLTPFNGLKAINPIAEVPGVKNGKAAVIKIPAEYLPGEFVLRIDYRAKERDYPYPSERVIFINKQDIELTVQPPYINNEEKTKFNPGEKENTVYSAFIKENNTRRMPVDLLKTFLLSYDRPKSEFYIQAVKEFEQRRLEYNAWLSDQAKIYHDLYVSSLFQFQYLPGIIWSADKDKQLEQLIENYFEGIDFKDTRALRSRELAMFMSTYMSLYGMQAKDIEQRDALFTQAGKAACEKASKGAPKFYGWMADYFYSGYETYNIKKGIFMLEKHINNPRCLTSKKQQIIKRMEGISKLVPGVLSPDFTISDNQGNNFQFHKYKGTARYKLLLFWSADCSHCKQLINELKQWYNQPANKKKVDIIAISLDETEANITDWKTAITGLLGWKNLHAKEGVNSPVADKYYILSTPVMFLVESENNIIVSVPENLEQLTAAIDGKTAIVHNDEKTVIASPAFGGLAMTG